MIQCVNLPSKISKDLLPSDMSSQGGPKLHQAFEPLHAHGMGLMHAGQSLHRLSSLFVSLSGSCVFGLEFMMACEPLHVHNLGLSLWAELWPAFEPLICLYQALKFSDLSLRLLRHSAHTV